MIKLLKYLKPYSLLIIILIVLVYIQVMADLQLPDYMATIVNKGIANEDMDLIWNTGIKMLLVTTIGAICTIIAGFLASKISTGFALTIREKVFEKVESFSLIEFNKFSTASLITRTTNDIQQMQTVFFIVLRIVLSAPIMAVGAVIKAYGIAPNMSWIMGLAVTILLLIIIILFLIAIPKFKQLQILTDKLNLIVRQILTGLRVIRAFNTETFEERKFAKINRQLTKINLFVNRLMVFMQPMMMLILNLTTILIIWVGSHLIASEELMIGDMMAFMQYTMQVIFAFLMISIVFIMIPRAAVSATRVSEVLDKKPTIIDPKKHKNSTTTSKGLIEFKNVTFTYPGADLPVLHDISFTANPNETTAFIGSTGSGKSTLINLIPRFFDVTTGEILIDGVNVRDMLLAELHKKIGYVPQKGILFSGTIKSNIKYGAPNDSDERMENSANIAQSNDFITKMEKKFNSPVVQGGTNFSGGQKQRLSIARALFVDPDIFIFDDSFSALDFKTDSNLRNALSKQIKNKTVLIVAQRINTILDADKIIVLDKGNIVGIGTHESLMKSCSVYKEIAMSQLSEKELGIGNSKLETRNS